MIGRSPHNQECRGLVWPALFLALLPALRTAAAEAPDFERDVAPIFVKRCLECHNERHCEGGLVLTTAARALAGGDGGAALIAGKPAESYLLSRVEAGEMPPLKKGHQSWRPRSTCCAVDRWRPLAGGRTLDLFEKRPSPRRTGMVVASAAEGAGFRFRFRKQRRGAARRANRLMRLCVAVDEKG
jgi:hypothetical protein